MGLYDIDMFPNLREEMRLIERAIAADLPVLGVCLGSQLLASALGGKVVPGPSKESGWHRVDRTLASGDDALFADTPISFPALIGTATFSISRGAPYLSQDRISRRPKPFVSDAPPTEYYSTWKYRETW